METELIKFEIEKTSRVDKKFFQEKKSNQGLLRFSMPDWYEDAATLLVEIAKQDNALYREILRGLKRIERNPLIGHLFFTRLPRLL